MYETKWKHKMNLIQQQITDKTVLDAGCGVGYNAFYFSEKAKLIFALDINEDNLNTAIEKYPAKNIRLFLGNLENMPFLDSTFDVVYSIDVIEHLPNPKQFISEAYRVLKPDGKLIIITPNSKNLSAQLSKVITYEMQSKLLNKLLQGDMHHYETFLRGNSIRKLDCLCRHRLKRVHFERYDSPQLVQNHPILFVLWKIKHHLFNNILLRWMYPSFYVEYKSNKIKE